MLSTGKWMAVQSLDNQILVYATSDRFRLNKKKHFKGHSVAGFACQLAFSPDGRFLVSGDGGGKLVMWDWKTSKLFKYASALYGCIGTLTELQEAAVSRCAVH